MVRCVGVFRLPLACILLTIGVDLGHGATQFKRGDANVDGAVDLTDPIRTLGSLFLGTSSLECLDAGDSNDDGTLDLADAIHTLVHLFLGGPAPGEPFRACGEDPTVDALNCDSFSPCFPKAAKVPFPNRGYVVGDSPSSIAEADIDGDDDGDLAVANHWSNTISVLSNTGDGTFGTRQEIAVGDKPECVALGDIDADGDADLAVVNSSDWASVGLDTVGTLRNDSGHFGDHREFIVGEYPRFLLLRDLDSDGDLDLIVANDGGIDSEGNVSLLSNRGDGEFESKRDLVAGEGPRHVALGDVDHDGDEDIAIATFGSDDASILRNDGMWTFESGLPLPMNDPIRVALVDLDRDVDLDLVVGAEIAQI